MLKLRWILLLLALGTVGAAWRVWSLSEERTGASLRASVARRLDAERPDYDAVLREIDLGLQLSRAERDRETERGLLQTRAEVYLVRRTFALALADCRELLSIVPREGEEIGDVLFLGARAAEGAGETELALGYARRLVAEDPAYPGIRSLLGRLELSLVDDRLEDVRALLDASLPTETALEGMELARRASALPADHPACRHALDSLRALLPEDLEAERIRALVAEAAEHLAGAREAYVAGLAGAAGPTAIEGVQNVFTRAGEDEAAATLGLLALERRLQPSYTGVLVRTALALVRVEKPSVAKSLIRRSIQRHAALQSHYRSLEPSLLLEWCSLLYELALWPELNRAATVLSARRAEFRGLTDIGTVPDFFLGVSRRGMGNAGGALASLSKVARMSRRPDVFPGEQVLAVLARADVFALFGQHRREEETLREATRFPPPPRDEVRGARAFGEVVLRLARKDLAAKRWMAAIAHLADAMRYLPGRRAELQPLWEQAGEEHLRARRQSIEGLARYLATVGLQLPTGNVDVYRLTKLGCHHLEAHRFQAAHIAARRVLEHFAGFPPALELDAAALRGLRRDTQSLDRLLTLAEDGSGGPDLLAEIRAVAEEDFTPAQRLRWYRVDPRGAALRDVARRLMSDGDVEGALAAIRPQGRGELEARDRLLAASVLGELGRWEECRRALERIEVDDPGFASAAGLVVLAGLRTRADTTEGDPLVDAFRRVYRASHLTEEGFDVAIDALLAAGLREEVRGLLEYLATRLEHQSPALLLRAAIGDVVAGRQGAAEDALDRAEAYLPGGEAQLGRVLAAVDGGDPDRIREEAHALLDEGFATTPHREALLRILTGEFGVARRLAVEAYAASEGRDGPRFLSRILSEVLGPTDPAAQESAGGADDGAWLSLATFAGTATFAQVAGILLGLDAGPWAAWSLARLRELPAAASTQTWPGFLEALALVRLGDPEEADARLVPLTNPAENFRFAWDLREEIAAAKFGTEPDSAALRVLRRARAKALGAADFEASEVCLLLAAERRSAGRLEDAARILAEGVAEHPAHFELGLALARARFAAGDVAGGLQEFDRLFETFSSEEVEPLVPEVLGRMRAAAGQGKLTDTAWWARIEALASRRPRDPAPALELARRTAETAGGRAGGGLARAREILDRFRERTDRVPVDSLRRGAGFAWVAFLAEYDPEGALALADEELLADPPSVALWRAHAVALAAVGRRRDALEDLRTLLLIVTDTPARLQIAGLLAELGYGPSVVLPTIAGLGGDSPLEENIERLLIYGRALVNGKPKEQARGIGYLTKAWRKFPAGNAHGIKAKIGRELSQALLTRAAPGDARLAASVLKELGESAVDPLRRDYYRALANLGRGK